MIWLNPVAWIGLAALGIPLAIHLLSRRDARVQRFPTLRFLGVSRLTPVRRTRISDLVLLVVRMAIVVAAVAALAQPRWHTAARTRADAGRVARAIVVDTSASMRRAVGATNALDSARGAARVIAAQSFVSRMIETAAPGRAIAGASAWLDAQSGARELVLVSDFQRGAVDSSDVAAIPTSVGVRAVRIVPVAVPADLRVAGAGGDLIARMTPTPELTTVNWRAAPPTAPREDVVRVIAAPRDRARADAALRAARSAVSWPADGGPVTIVYVGAAERAALLRDARRVDAAWMGDALARIRGDALLGSAAASATLVAGATRDTAFVSLGRSADAWPTAFAARTVIDGRPTLTLFALVDPGSLASSALMAAAARAVSATPPAEEVDPEFVSDAELARWQRAAGPQGTPARAGTEPDSDGRWFWIVALALLAAEFVLRRARAIPGAGEIAR